MGYLGVLIGWLSYRLEAGRIPKPDLGIVYSGDMIRHWSKVHGLALRHPPRLLQLVCLEAQLALRLTAAIHDAHVRDSVPVPVRDFELGTAVGTEEFALVSLKSRLFA